MTDRDKHDHEEVQKGHIPQDDDYGVRGGYQPETSQGGKPPSGGGGGKEPAKDEE
jgi:hypothetical protein